MRSEDCIVISDKISKLKCGTRPVKGINSARNWVNGYHVSATNSVTYVSLHTPSTTTLNAWFCQAFPFLGGSGVLLWLHSIPCLCPLACLLALAFASVSRRFKALFTTQHRHRPVVYPATRHLMFYASYRSLRYACGYTST